MNFLTKFCADDLRVLLDQLHHFFKKNYSRLAGGMIMKSFKAEIAHIYIFILHYSYFYIEFF